MCGIAGFIQLQGSALRSEYAIPILKQMGVQLKRRGPDNEQTYLDDSIALIFERLSIVDLKDGMQPFHNENSNIILVANGEIYNHVELKKSLKHPYQFRSQSDCEVLLPLYEEHGLNFLQHVNGMFGIAIWDKNKKQLILARDRLGIKPMYYCQLPDKLLFGSEMKCLFAHPDSPKAINWNEVFRCSFLLSSAGEVPSFFNGIRNLPAGNLLVVDLATQQIKEHSYWDVLRPSEEEYQSDHRTSIQIIEEYQHILCEAIQLNLMSDVPMGLFLSGGIDSASIAAVSAKHVNLKTFSVLSQSTFANEDARYGHEVAKLFGHTNHQVLFNWHQNVFNSSQWKELLWVTEHPSCNAEHLYKYNLHLFAKTHYPDLKVMLLGQGSDEFNGGYSTIQSRGNSVEYWPLFMRILDQQNRGELYLSKQMELVDYCFAQFPLLKFDYLMQINGDTSRRDDPWYYNTLSSRKKLQIYNLWHEDRTAAGNGIESRVPFLDHRLVEFCMKVPPNKRSEMFWDKNILREAMQPYLPEQMRKRTKIPFFYGADTRYTNRLLYNILMSDNQALINEAFDNNQAVISRNAINNAMALITKNPEYLGVEGVLLLTNAALLEKIAQDIGQYAKTQTAFPSMSEITIQGWEKETDQLELLLGTRRKELCESSVLQFPPGVFLAKDDSKVKQKANNYMVVNNKLTYSFGQEDNPHWLEFLRRIDGEKSVQTILEEIGTNQSTIRKYMEEAIDYHILCIADNKNSNEKSSKNYS